MHLIRLSLSLALARPDDGEKTDEKRVMESGIGEYVNCERFRCVLFLFVFFPSSREIDCMHEKRRRQRIEKLSGGTTASSRDNGSDDQQ